MNKLKTGDLIKLDSIKFFFNHPNWNWSEETSKLRINDVVIVVSPQVENGFINVLSTNGKTGWLYKDNFCTLT